MFSLAERGIEVQIVAGHELSHEDVAGASAVFSAGGDGTFLQVCDGVYLRVIVHQLGVLNHWMDRQLAL